jgi:hypothetical protein
VGKHVAGETRIRAPILWCGAPSSAARAHARWGRLSMVAPPLRSAPVHWFTCAPGQRNRHRRDQVRIRKEKSRKAVRRPEAHVEDPFPLPLSAARDGPCCRPLGIETHGRPMAGAENDDKTVIVNRRRRLASCRSVQSPWWRPCAVAVPRPAAPAASMGAWGSQTIDGRAPWGRRADAHASAQAVGRDRATCHRRRLHGAGDMRQGRRGSATRAETGRQGRSIRCPRGSEIFFFIWGRPVFSLLIPCAKRAMLAKTALGQSS